MIKKMPMHWLNPKRLTSHAECGALFERNIWNGDGTWDENSSEDVNKVTCKKCKKIALKEADIFHVFIQFEDGHATSENIYDPLSYLVESWPSRGYDNPIREIVIKKAKKGESK